MVQSIDENHLIFSVSDYIFNSTNQTDGTWPFFLKLFDLNVS